ncbi:response regulator transcription factor [Acidovorax sp. SDU_ACID1]|uniref:response regulator transcription factor n=1 Tax=Acidovorax sp. SDU_ACID1 TaxID=3136632 RepID=UPI0038735C91
MPHQVSLSSSKSTIAVVAQDEAIRSNVSRFLLDAGMQAWDVESAERFYGHLLRKRADLVVVELERPGSNLDLVKRLAVHNIPVVALTLCDAKSRTIALNAGALQCVGKTTDLRVLAAGIRSQLRRLSPSSMRAQQFRSWKLDTFAHRLIAPNLKAVPLTSRESELLTCLMATQDVLVTKETLIGVTEAVHSQDNFHRIEAQLSRLRRKTLKSTGLALPVRAVFGRGLVFMSDAFFQKELVLKAIDGQRNTG